MGIEILTVPDLPPDAACEALRDRLAALAAEIRHYPTPIAGCDDQFNYLCEKRDVLAREVARCC